MAIGRIVSGGQTGVDRAALDVAARLGIARGGWCPRGRRAEDGAIPAAYPLAETPSEEYAQRTAWNVRDSDGTLILTIGAPRGGTALTITYAEDESRPYLIVDLGANGDPQAVRDWLRANEIDVLNVAGPRESSQPGIYERAAAFLTALLPSET